jgi:hypothetical protein
MLKIIENLKLAMGVAVLPTIASGIAGLSHEAQITALLSGMFCAFLALYV